MTIDKSLLSHHAFLFSYIGFNDAYDHEAIARQDDVDNTIFECISELITKATDPEELPWNIEEIGRVRDVIEAIAIEHGMTKEQFYPTVNVDGDGAAKLE